MLTARYYPYVHASLIIGLTLLAASGLSGCGATGGARLEALTVLSMECGYSVQDGAMSPEVVVLDWTGGFNSIYPDTYFEGIDLGSFATAEAGTLAGDAETFKELVRQEVMRIYCEWPEANVLVYNGEGHLLAYDSIVHISQAVPPNGGTDIGEGQWDICNRRHDNAALVYGERVRQLAGAYTYDEWVNVFANVCAHEIAHTLGYAHVHREDVEELPDSPYIELMLGYHTMDEMRLPHRFLADQSYCPQDLSTSRILDEPVISCGGGTGCGE